MRTKILIAEDNDDICDVFQLILDERAYALDIRKNGLDLLKDDLPVPDLFLLDKNIPGFDGLLACRHLKSNPRTSHVPVIIISCNSNVAKEWRQAGADFFIEKPFDMNHLIQTIEHYTQPLAASPEA